MYLTIALLLAGCVPGVRSEAVRSAPNADKIEHLGVTYQKLKGAKLAQAIIGSTLTSLDVVTSGGQETFFGADGRTFWHYGEHNFLSYGSYKVYDELVCATTAYSQYCFDLFESDKGDFLRILPPTYNSPERISLHPGAPPVPATIPLVGRPDYHP
jgi:hypothetical protein